MRLGFTSILALHWAVVFAALAYGSIANVDGSLGGLLDALGIAPVHVSAPGSVVLLAVLLAGNLAFAAMLFVWSFLAGLFPQLSADSGSIEPSHIAYCAAVSSMTMLLIICLARGGSVPYVALAVQLAALGASYLVSFAERLNSTLMTAPEANDVKAAARLMALGAAHGAMLSRIAGRDFTAPDGAR